jgi:hypothetical protein
MATRLRNEAERMRGEAQCEFDNGLIGRDETLDEQTESRSLEDLDYLTEMDGWQHI